MTQPPRVLSKQEAANYCGCNTLAAFDQWRAKGIVPGPIPGTTRWDRKALDAALDRASGLVTASAPELNSYERWRAAEVAAGRLPPKAKS
ncbi:hypothetical protein FNJ47_03080 [Bradyrhizobium sp. UFLA 03-164]|uniref:Uncharacterized protein n=1 Tax=Bradyrhizobium uaiense TaxID=2594946 RepID=A0A6P1B8Z2_9BRAD|nr:hypothetical protein [Bradyrhizobium uaiense]